MKNPLSRVLIILGFLSFFFIGNVTPALAADKQRIYDFAEVLSDSEINSLESIAAEYSEKRETDFVIVTVNDADKDLQLYMDDFYDEEEFGYHQVHGETAIIGIDIADYKRDVVLSGYNGLEEKLSPDRLDQIRHKVTPLLSEGDYFGAFEKFITLSADYMQYRPGVNPENPLFKTTVQIAIALVFAAIIVWLLARNVKPRMTTTSATYRDDEQTQILEKRDRYIRTTVTKKRKPKQTSSGSGGGGGIGRTSAGHSRSSSRGKF